MPDVLLKDLNVADFFMFKNRWGFVVFKIEYIESSTHDAHAIVGYTALRTRFIYGIMPGAEILEEPVIVINSPILKALYG